MEPVSPELLERLLDEHAAALELFASQWTSSPEDCLQEAFIALAGQRRAPRDAVAWLYAVVRKQAMKQFRSDQRRRTHETRAQLQRRAQREPPVGTAAAPAATPENVTIALATLPPDEREVIVARIWGELTYQQIAHVAGASRSSVHRRYQRGLELLRERLDLPCKTT